jgi:translation initiation factor 2D
MTATKLVLVNLFTIPSHWTILLRLDPDEVQATHANSEERKGTGMLTTPEVRKLFEGYILREALIPKSRPDQIQLDAPLTKVLYKKDPNPPTVLLRKDVYKLITSKCNPAYALVEMPGSRITKLAKGSPPLVEIEVAMRQSRKFVTRIRGLEDYGIDPPQFATDVSRRLACAGSLETSSTRAAVKKGRVELVFQGNLVESLEALLTGDESLSTHGGVKGSPYAIPQKVLSITLRKGVPGRKKK